MEFARNQSECRARRIQFLCLLAALLALGAAVLAGAALDGLTWRYFPTVKWSGGPVSLLTMTAYLALCAVPVILDRREDRKWTALRWKI